MNPTTETQPRTPLRQWQWRWRNLMSQIWPRVTLYALASGAVALLGVFAGPLLPAIDALSFDASSVDAKLSILASSMLAVSTFSLGVMTSAFASASSAATPRVTQLLLADKTSQSVLATFLGAFVFSLVGIITLEFGIYGPQGRLILFVATIIVYLIIVATFVRWIQMLRTFGRLGDAIARVEEVAIEAFDERIHSPFLGCQPLHDRHPIPHTAIPLPAGSAAYITHIDFPALENAAAEKGARLFLPAAPGRFVFPAEPIAWIDPGPSEADDDFLHRIRQAFSLGDSRTFHQDPRFGMIVLSEIASRALSPAVNDPGTAIIILTHGVRILSRWQDRAEPEILYPHLWLETLSVGDLFDDFFRPIARDGAAIVEVQQWLQHAFIGLTEAQPATFSAACRRHSAEALARAEIALPLDIEKSLIRQLAARLQTLATKPRPAPL
ncbi:MAG: DUF2254 domain-containing protein [Akkermansiaceae bacterium]|jgi:uncharacterized membrane protein|nr:DUF2254 domain-containing protein [Akkermansiaceae bacterium]